MDSVTETARTRRHPLLWWDVVVAAVLVVMVGGLLIDGRDEPDSVWQQPVVVIALLAALSLAYAFLCRPALRAEALYAAALRGELPPLGVQQPGSPARTRLALGVFCALIAVSCAAYPNFATLQVIGHPLIWTLCREYREAVRWAALLSVLCGGGMAVAFLRYGRDSALIEAGWISLLSLLFSVAMGTWITRVFERGEEYRSMAERLRVSQVEVAELSSQAGAAAERERLARELHDTLTQTLTGLVMLSEQAERRLANGETVAAAERLARLTEGAREAMTEARALVATSWPLDEGGLVRSIERVAERLRADTGLRVACALNPQQLTREQEVVLLRAAQEGLANARKHARAASVWVTLDAVGEDAARRVRLRVEDDGVGPRRLGSAGAGLGRASSPHVEERTRSETGTAGEAYPALGEGGGFGLSGLAERLRLAGGTLSFGPGTERGSELVVEIPLCAEPEGGAE